ncbi:MAG: carbohydrate ABC transporter permease [Mycobacterium sp.]
MPFVVPFALFVAWPLVGAIIASFEKISLRSRSFVGLENFARLLSDQATVRSFLNTGLLLIYLVPLVTIVGLGIAAVVVKLSRRWQNYFRAAYYIPVVASSVILSLIWLWILNPVYGLLNALVGVFGIGPVEWLGQVETALPSVALVLFSSSLGVPVILFTAGLNAIPRDLYEAARLDGASWWSEFRLISLPLLRPVIGFVVVVTTIGTAQTFAVVQLLTKGGPFYATQTVVFQIWQRAFTLGDLGTASAMSVVLLVLTLGAAVVLLRVFRGASDA